MPRLFAWIRHNPLLTAVGVVAAVVVVVGIIGLAAVSPTGTADTASSTPHASPAFHSRPTRIRPVPTCRAASVRALARRVFRWNTTDGTRDDLVRRIVAGGDPTGAETSGLLTDLDSYLPTPPVWAQLRTYDTRQWLTVTSLRTPAGWGRIVRSSGQALRAGTVAVTVTGTRHRAGTIDGTTTTIADPVTFTLFLLCPRPDAPARLLRLSTLGDPLP